MKQISVFLENEPNALVKLTGVLAENKINLKSINIAETKDFGVVRIIVDKTEEAIEVLKENSLMRVQTEVIGVEIPDVVGGLHGILENLRKNDINIEYMYSILERREDKAVMVFKFKDISEAIRIINDSGYKIIYSNFN
jgi:hypothetical protein